MKNELIKVKYESDKTLVSARELHEFLEVTERFQQWFDKRVDKYGFIENEDFTKTETIKITHNNAKLLLPDYNITVEMAIILLRSVRNRPKSIALIEHLSKILGVSIEVKEQKRLEYQFGDMLDKITGFNWERQYLIDGGKYRLDFYLKDVLIVEYDESHHKHLEKEDNERIRYCRDWLSNYEGDGDGWLCPVIRVKEGEELQGLNRIIRHLAGFELFDTQWNYKCDVCDLAS